MPDDLQNTLAYLTVGLFLLALLLLVLSVRFFRHSRTDVFWRRRRDAGQRGWRALVFSFVLIILSGFLCLFTLVAALINEDESETPTAAALVESPSPTLPPTNTARAPEDTPLPPTPTEMVAATPADTPTPVVIVITATPMVTPSATPFPTFTPLAPPPVSTVTPQPDALIRITALDDQISDALTPVNPRAAFRTGTTRIYLFVEFREMTRGVLWRRELYRNAILIDSGAYLWGLDTDGSSYFFFGNVSGFPPGDYDIRLFIGSGSDPVNMASFVIGDVP